MSNILIGRALLNEIPTTLSGVKKVLIVYPQPLATTAEALSENLKDSGFEVLLAEVPAAEDAKRVEVAAFCWQIMGKSDFNRNDAVIGLGGGSTTDLAGFVAATWLRGVRSVLIPTTLLGMVDAAIGGKTGINTTEGKNLVGAFHSPHSVVIDLDTLHSLARNELLAGMAEVVKYGFIADPWILDTLENDPAATDPASSVFEELIRRSVAIKEDVTLETSMKQESANFLTMGTLWVMRSSMPKDISGDTGQQYRLAWFSPQSYQCFRASYPRPMSLGTAVSLRRLASQLPTGQIAGHSFWTPCKRTRRLGLAL